MERTTMYAIYFETKVYFGDKPIGDTIELSDPDIIPAANDEEAIKRAFERAELIEYLKSLRLSNKASNKKILARVRAVVRMEQNKDIVIHTPKYKRGDFKARA